ncbi:FAD:protein FMN transferase [Diaphorobacter sp. MNS-0]|uniref:FAD:protein FMN transferase n=1 Tax=Diaphorobacter sp. MNS-0 TaxID=2866628 RepID=UPI001C73C1F7|nr:FAD:protein FMN transferase [Diaphorobacter sp. MNS-0]QYY25562.1 FAD:protein FMN transferase [Diaphorobacter sp. MNS-0]
MHRLTLHGPAMGTRWSVTCDAPPTIDRPALQAALAAAVQQVDAQMSPWLPGSALNRLNHAPTDAWVTLPAEIMEVLACALDICRLSAGAFDPAVGALVNAWGFGAARDAPDAAAIRAASAATAARLPTHEVLELDRAALRARKHLSLRTLLQIDLCGIAKGYAVDRMAAVLRQHGVRHALAALDGELRAVGGQADGQPWAVAVESPEAGRRAVHSVLELDNLAVATSGDYRHCLDVGGARLAHTMDARRAAPVRNEVASVTVLARQGMHADAWATALLVAGPGEGLALARRMGLEALWLLRRGGTLVSLGSGRLGADGCA